VFIRVSGERQEQKNTSSVKAVLPGHCELGTTRLKTTY
jgi:hypothetical protein